MVRPKKSLGQHFLRDDNIARKIVHSLRINPPATVLEVGAGTGVLTRHLLELPGVELYVIEIDRESIAFLREHYPALGARLIEGDFLKADLDALVPGPFSIIGNFPYNISSQIFFKVLEHRDRVGEVVGMVQREVAERIAAPHGSRTYGILSVLLQTFYDVEVLFRVSPGVFVPPPKVTSAVVRLTRNGRATLECDEQRFVKVVKQAFNNRRKTLRNALKNLNLPAEISSLPLLDLRAEQLSAEQFIQLTLLMEHRHGGH
ncbi:MAG: 16S rRNA (adenine(1518)-N(6)/adenine(1519)-N(6))-dimethyltransferase RsmA [Bacteroidota bacterium]|jgi:16S rRNA (adenine1518-N6/adenine1519-N6)-dimethyltransferase|nr:MAG: 16S rRNA (adenine(1518)-N(6)/adenine(1519)-N(6))-dimethyltransferase [Bacteroidota bacterium]